jgi:hypothetical protein
MRFISVSSLCALPIGERCIYRAARTDVQRDSRSDLCQLLCQRSWAALQPERSREPVR